MQCTGQNCTDINCRNKKKTETVHISLKCKVSSPNDGSKVTHQSADFQKNLLVRHCAGLIQLVPLPQEAGLVTSAILDMPVKAIVGNVGFAPSEELHLNLAIVLVEIGLDVLLLKLDK